MLNALSIDLAVELDSTLVAVADDNEVRVAVLTGASSGSPSMTKFVRVATPNR